MKEFENESTRLTQLFNKETLGQLSFDEKEELEFLRDALIGPAYK